MSDRTSSYFSEIGGDFKGIQGDISGGIINQYIITQKSGIEIRSQSLITGSPYKGLVKFEADDKDKFFGRDRWITELTNYLENNNILLLLGASGSGKSSLIQAGLIPQLKDRPGYNQLINLNFTPDVDPFESFYTCLFPKYKAAAKLAQTVKEDTLIKVVESLKQNSQWLIFIDQFEELFTITPKTERNIFIKSLMQLMENSDASVKVILTMRADFLDKLSPYPKLGRIHDRSSRILTDMDDSDLRLAIAEPAARNGVTFESGLIDQIIADFHQQPGALPLLQYTLNEVWEKDHIHDRILNIETYQELGGVTGALQKQADDIYNEFTGQQQKAFEQIFIGLIGLKSKEPVSIRSEIATFEKNEIQKQVLTQLIDHRLLVSNREGGKATVEVAHEALLRSWKVLQNLIRENEEIINLGNRLSADAKQWDKSRQKDDLWSGSRLTRIVELQKQQSLPHLENVAIEFINASVTQAERQRNQKIRTARGIAAGSLVAVGISSGLGVMAWQKTNEAEFNQADSLGRYSQSLFNNEHKELEAFVQAIKAGKILQKQHTTNPEVINALQEAIYQGSERNRLEGHESVVRSVSFSPDGKTLATGSGDKTLKLWNVETGKEIRTIKGHEGVVYSVSFSPDGKTLATGSEDKTIKLWNVETGKEIRTIKGHEGSVLSVSFSPDGKTLATGSEDKTIKLWNVETGKEIRTIKGDEGFVYSVSFSPDGKRLATGSTDNTIKLWNVETGKEIRTLKGHESPVYSVSFSLDGKTLATGSDDNTSKLWNVETGKEIRTIKGHEGVVLSVSFSPDGKTLATGSYDNTIKLWNVETGKEIRTLKGHESPVYSVSFSLDGKTLATGSDDNTSKLWNVETGKEIRTIKGHEGVVLSVSFSPDGKTLATGSYDNTIKLWNVETGKEIRTIKGHEGVVLSVSFSPDGKTLATGSGDNTLKLWNVETANVIRTLKGHESVVFSVSFSPDGKTLATGSANSTLKLWNVETGKEIRTIKGHEGVVLSVSFSPDGKTLATGSDDNTSKLWNVETGKEIRTLKGHEGVVSSVSFSPDGKTLATGSVDKTIKLWNVETGNVIRTLKGHEGSVSSVSFSPDGKTLATGSADNTIKLWDLSLDFLMVHSCDWVRNYLTYNPNVSESDRHLCDGIGTKK